MRAISLKDISMDFMAVPNPDQTGPGPIGMGGATAEPMPALPSRTARSRRWRGNSPCFAGHAADPFALGANRAAADQRGRECRHDPKPSTARMASDILRYGSAMSNLLTPFPQLLFSPSSVNF